jgi:hypothetical protein
MSRNTWKCEKGFTELVSSYRIHHEGRGRSTRHKKPPLMMNTNKNIDFIAKLEYEFSTSLNDPWAKCNWGTPENSVS